MIKLRTLPCRWFLAVDPGALFGASLFIRGTLVGVWSGRASRKYDSDVIGAILKTGALKVADGALVIEDQYVPPKPGRKNPQTTLKGLLRRRYEWEFVAQDWGIEAVSEVHPSSWQAGLKAAPTTSKDVKARAMAMAKSHWPAFNFKTQDAADSACIGMYYRRVQVVEHPSYR